MQLRVSRLRRFRRICISRTLLGYSTKVRSLKYKRTSRASFAVLIRMLNFFLRKLTFFHVTRKYHKTHHFFRKIWSIIDSNWPIFLASSMIFVFNNEKFLLTLVTHEIMLVYGSLVYTLYNEDARKM